jgi:hypothetical protein
MNDNILNSTNQGDTVTKSTPPLPLVKFTSRIASTRKGTTTKQKRGKHAHPDNDKKLYEANRDSSPPGLSSSSLFGGEDDYEI